VQSARRAERALRDASFRPPRCPARPARVLWAHTHPPSLGTARAVKAARSRHPARHSSLLGRPCRYHESTAKLGDKNVFTFIRLLASARRLGSISFQFAIHDCLRPERRSVYYFARATPSKRDRPTRRSVLEHAERCPYCVPHKDPVSWMKINASCRSTGGSSTYRTHRLREAVGPRLCCGSGAISALNQRSTQEGFRLCSGSFRPS